MGTNPGGTTTTTSVKGKLQDYLQDAAMDALLRNTIIYNVAWEDPRIDGKVLGLGPEDRLLMLTTGGCNVLDRLLDGVGHIVSVDLNPSQNALLELRLAAARACTHEQFFQLFAHSNRRLFDALYPGTLRPLLSPSAQSFWDTNQGNFFDDFFYAGASGGLARILCWLVWLFGLQPVIRAMLQCRTIDEQCALLDKEASKVDRLVRCFDALLPAFCPLAGVPASQLRLATDDVDKPTSIIRLFINRVFRMTHLAGDNYFYYAYLYGKYSRQNCPRYLRPENFAALKAAATRVTVKTKLLHEAAEEYPDGYFTGMILLDHMDWLSESQIQHEWGVFCKKLHPEAGRVLWRSFASQQRWAMLKFLDFDKRSVAAAEKATPDRVGMYNSTHLARVPPGLAICAPASALSGGASLGVSAERAACLRGLLAVLELLPLLGRLLSYLVSLFLLPAAAAPTAAAPTPEGRYPLLRMLPGLKGGVWVDLGAGLADGLGAGGDAPRMYAAIHTVCLDAAADGATPADKPSNVRAHVLASLADVAEATGVAPGGADVVSLSHALVSEADWEERLATALMLLRPGGLLAVTDLAPPNTVPGTAGTLRRPQPTGVARSLLAAVRSAFWGAARPRAPAPFHTAVLRKLRRATKEVHLDEQAAGWMLSRKPDLAAAHFVFVGRTPA